MGIKYGLKRLAKTATEVAKTVTEARARRARKKSFQGSFADKYIAVIQPNV